MKIKNTLVINKLVFPESIDNTTNKEIGFHLLLSN